ncbi:hypothetical protein ACSBR1_013373 [Camellia fascicularis]
MWCQWVKSYLLKGQSLWRVKMPSDPSWVWRKILSLHPVIYPFILHKIGNGGDVFLWFDNWHPLGSLWVRFGARVVYDTAFGMDAKVSRIVNNRSWSWPKRRRSFLQEMIEHTPLTFTPNSDNDTVIWVPSSDGKSLSAVVTRFAFTCTVYQLWIVRNNCIFRKEKIPEEIVIKGIVDMIRFRVMSITNLKLHPSDSWFLSSWRLPNTVLKATTNGMRVESSVNCGLSDGSTN